MSAVEGRKILILNGGLDRETGGMTGDTVTISSASRSSVFMWFLYSRCVFAAVDFVQAVANGLNRSSTNLCLYSKLLSCTDMAN